MDGDAFLARVRDYHEAGWRLAIINATAVVPAAALAHGAHGAIPEGPAAEPGSDAIADETPDVFEIAWGFVREGRLETIREQIDAGETVPSISEFFGAAFLYENEIRELFGIDVTGIGVDLKGQLYKTATRVPFSHSAVKARLAALAAAAPEKRS
jgi:ech hydrogenase subunit D